MWGYVSQKLNHGFCDMRTHWSPPRCPKNAQMLWWHTKSGRETDRKEISLKEKHIRLHHLHAQAFSQPMSIAALGYTVCYNLSADWTVCSSLHFELSCCMRNKANGSKVQSITGRWRLNTFLQTNILQLAPWLPPYCNRLETLAAPPRAPSALEEDSPSVSTAQTTSAILQTPNSFFFFLSGKKNRIPRPPLVKSPLPLA